MNYELTFLESAKKEWDKLNKETQKQFKNKLTKRLIEPWCPKDQLSGMLNCYKIKLRNIGYRLVYQVFDTRLVVQIVAVGRRDKNIVYNSAQKRLF